MGMLKNSLSHDEARYQPRDRRGTEAAPWDWTNWGLPLWYGDRLGQTKRTRGISVPKAANCSTIGNG